MSNIKRDLTEADIAKLFPELREEARKEAASNFTKYLKLVARIYNRLEAEGRLDEIQKNVLRHEWEKRSKGKNE